MRYTPLVIVSLAGLVVAAPARLDNQVKRQIPGLSGDDARELLGSTKRVIEKTNRLPAIDLSQIPGLNNILGGDDEAAAAGELIFVFV